MTNDTINALFELMGSIFILMHCHRVYVDKQVHGVSIPATFGFFCWGLWNIYYYPSLGQSWSFYAGIAVCAANFVYVGMMVYYTRATKGIEE